MILMYRNLLFLEFFLEGGVMGKKVDPKYT